MTLVNKPHPGRPSILGPVTFVGISQKRVRGDRETHIAPTNHHRQARCEGAEEDLEPNGSIESVSCQSRLESVFVFLDYGGLESRIEPFPDRSFTDWLSTVV